MENARTRITAGIGRRRRLQQLRLPPRPGRDDPNVVLAALDAGINFFDTADIYGATQSEVFLGVARSAPVATEVVIATKFGMPIDDDHYGASPDVRALRRARTRCGDSAPTTSTSTSCTTPTRSRPHRRHPGRAARTRRRGQGARDRLLEPERGRSASRGEGRGRERGPRSPRCRTSTRCSIANPSATACSTPATSSVFASCPSTRSPTDCSPARCARASRFPKGTALEDAGRAQRALVGRRTPRTGGGAARLRPGDRDTAAEPGLLVAAEPPSGQLGHRRASSAEQVRANAHAVQRSVRRSLPRSTSSPTGPTRSDAHAQRG
jgi:hypothetical protein